MNTIKKFFQNLRNCYYMGSLNDGNRRERRSAKRLAKTLCVVK